MDYLFVVCLAILVFFMTSIFSRKINHISDKIFIFWLVLVLLAETTFFLSSHNLFHDFHWVYEFACASHVLHGTIFYFYVLSLVDRSFQFEKNHILHIVPFVVYMGYKTTVKSIGLVDCLEEGGCSHSDNVYAVISVYMKFIIILGYVMAAYALIWKIKKDEQINRSNPYGVKWIYSIGNGVLLLLTAVFIIRLLKSFGIQFVIDQVMLVNIIVSVFVISFVYIYTKYAYIFAHPLRIEKDEEKPRDESAMSQEEDQYNYISLYIIDNRLFKDGDLTLRKLSSLIDIPEHTISHVINRVTDRSYSDFINSYRINFFLELIDKKAHEDQTLLYLAYECGFNSKSSFNRVFKQFHEITPSEYIKTRTAK